MARGVGRGSGGESVGERGGNDESGVSKNDGSDAKAGGKDQVIAPFCEAAGLVVWLGLLAEGSTK